MSPELHLIAFPEPQRGNKFSLSISLPPFQWTVPVDIPREGLLCCRGSGAGCCPSVLQQTPLEDTCYWTGAALLIFSESHSIVCFKNAPRLPVPPNETLNIWWPFIYFQSFQIPSHSCDLGQGRGQNLNGRGSPFIIQLSSIKPKDFFPIVSFLLGIKTSFHPLCLWSFSCPFLKLHFAGSAFFEAKMIKAALSMPAIFTINSIFWVIFHFPF